MIRWSASCAALFCALSSSVLAGPIETECASEIGMLCPGQQDIRGCLKQNKAALTPLCKDALNGRARPTSAPSEPPAAAGAIIAATGDSPAYATGQRHPLKIIPDYNGPSAEAAKVIQSFLAAEAANTHREVADKLGFPESREGLAHHYIINLNYQPAAPMASTVVNDNGTHEDWSLTITMNVAGLEDCLTSAFLKSILRHEMTHAIVWDMSMEYGLPFSQWLDEGLAVLMEEDPGLGLRLSAALKHFGRETFPPSCDPRSRSEGSPSHGVLGTCGLYYSFAARRILQSSSGTLKKLIMIGDEPEGMEAAIAREMKTSWTDFKEAVQKDSLGALNDLPWWWKFHGKWWKALVICRG